MEEIVAFLQKLPPFEFLPPEDLAALASGIAVEWHAKGTRILRKDGPPSESLRVIREGGIRLSIDSPSGGELVIDYRGKGETFGFVSLISKDRVRSDVTAVEDTTCYLLPKGEFLRLLESNRVFTEYFLKFNLTKYVDRIYGEMQSRSMHYGSGDRLLFATRADDISSKKLVTVGELTSLRDCAKLMNERRISALIIHDPQGEPTGIVTDRDFREKAVAEAMTSGSPVRAIMNPSPVTVDSTDSCFEVILRMLQCNSKHVLVRKAGAISGIVTQHDLLTLQGASPLSLTQEIESGHSVASLAAAAGKMSGVVGLLLKEGAHASHITQVMTEIQDRLVRRLLWLAERKLGPSPIPFCWIVFGSEGRKEQTFRADQDNAIVYADGGTPEMIALAREYFASLAEFMRENLASCGFPPCQGGYMASNPLWRKSAAEWKTQFTQWIKAPTAEAIGHSLVFLDFRPVAGEFALAEELRLHLATSLVDQRAFFGRLANQAVCNPPPLGFLKALILEKHGVHKDELNLKVRGIAPIVDLARLFALEHGVTDTSTIERLRALSQKNCIIAELAGDLEQAFEFLMMLRVHHQYERIVSGAMPDNFINPSELGNLEKRSIKEVFELVASAQRRMVDRYKAFIW